MNDLLFFFVSVVVQITKFAPRREMQRYAQPLHLTKVESPHLMKMRMEENEKQRSEDSNRK
jgi:hypothetical protein